jgi:hypothetical protein
LFLWEYLNLKKKIFCNVLIHHIKVLYLLFFIHEQILDSSVTIRGTAITFSLIWLSQYTSFSENESEFNFSLICLSLVWGSLGLLLLLFIYFETRSLCVAQASLELAIFCLSAPSPKYWDYQHAPSCPAQLIVFWSLAVSHCTNRICFEYWTSSAMF